MKKITLIFIVLLTISCSKNQEKISFKTLQGSAFGTTYSIIYKDYLSRDFSQEIDSIIYLMNKSLSIYIPNSDISKINQGDSTIVIDDFFKEVFLKSERIFKETDGYFDPTVGVLVNAWGFGPKESVGSLKKDKIDSLLLFVGFKKVQLIDHKIVKEHPSISFDFNAIAKGFGIDLIGRFLEGKQCENYLIELGGEIRARGVSDKKKFWRVGIEDPHTDGSRSYERIITLNNQSMATSGNYRKFKIDKNGQKFVHTINAKTGYATESNLLSATVISNLDCADVDGYATAFMAMGLEKTKTFLSDHPELIVFLIFENEKGELNTFSNSDNSN